MIRATLDANVVASGAVGDPAHAPAAVLDRWFAGRFRLVLSEPLLGEVERTLTKRYFRQRFSEQDAEDLLAALRIGSAIVPLPEHLERIATHPEDDRILATAVNGAAGYLVTGDRQLRALGEYRGVRVLLPREFLARLEEERSARPGQRR